MEKETKKTGGKREITGVVTSNGMEKTVKVSVDTVERHPEYSKVIKKRRVFFAHTDVELNIGDKVVIRESRPFSKNVRWIVINKQD